MAAVRVIAAHRYLRRPRRWLRRTRWMVREIGADLGLRGAASHGPAWWRDNPFLRKAGRTELRRFGIGVRLLVAVGVLSSLLLAGLWLEETFAGALRPFLAFFFGMPFPLALFAILALVHTLLISNARSALTISPAEEARRGTLPDLLLTPLRRAEMLLAMGVGPARTAGLIALAGLPIYLLLAALGGPSGREIASLYLLFALLAYAPPSYALPALSGAPVAPTPAPAGRRGRTMGGGSVAWLWPLLSVLFVSQVFGLLRGAWLAHLMAAFHLSFGRLGLIALIFTWPTILARLLGEPLDFFHLSLPPLLFVLPLAVLNWAAGALGSAAALSAGNARELRALPIASRARTLARWTARAAALCALGVVWRAWVDSGDTAGLAGGAPGTGGWDAAGLALLLGGLSLPTVCARALATGPRRRNAPAVLRPPARVLRRAARRAVRPLCVAGVTFLLACAFGGLSPLAPPIPQTLGRIALAGAASVVWAVGLRRLLPRGGALLGNILLYGLPLAALSLPGFGLLSALSPASAWAGLFPEAPALLARFPLWPLAPPPPFAACLTGASLTGLALMGVGSRMRDRPSAPNSGGVGRQSPVRNAAQTAALMGWITRRTDNPLFTYEMRTRTRSGGWADWRYFVPLALGAAILLGLTFPAFVNGFAFFSPFHFFPGAGLIGPRLSSPSAAWTNLASLLLAGQVYLFGRQGQTIGESLIARDRQRGLWGFILLTPLTSRQIFWGKVSGQTLGFVAAWAVCGLCSLLFYLPAAPAVGLGPALAAWAIGQVFVAALFALGVGVGAAPATFPIFLQTLRGASTLLLVALAGGGLWLILRLLPLNPSDDWQTLAERLLLGTGYALALTVPLFAFAAWRFERVRRQDVAFGDGVE